MLESADPDALTVLFVQLAVVLAVARLLGEAARHLGFAPVVGELLTGIVLGPSLIGALAPGLLASLFPPGGTAALQAVSWLGLTMLLVLTGLETDLVLVRRKAGAALAIAAGGIVVPFASGFGFGLVLPDRFLVDPTQRVVFALFIATAMSISAIPVIARVLRDMGVLESEVGQLTLVAAMVNDVVGWLLLSLVAGLARSGTAAVGDVGESALLLLGFLLAAFTVGRWAVERLMRWVEHAFRGATSHVSVLMALAFATGALTQSLGLEAVLGAFVVGLVVGASAAFDRDAAHAFAVVTIGVFAPVFFATAGLAVDLSALADPVAAAVGVLALAVAVGGKFLGTYLGARATGIGTWEAVGMGAGLNARGAMELIVAAVGRELGVLTVEMYSVIVLVAVVTSLMAPPLLRWSFARADAAAGRESTPSPD